MLNEALKKNLLLRVEPKHLLGEEAHAALARNRKLCLEEWLSVARVLLHGEALGLADVVAALTPCGFQWRPMFILSLS